MGVSAIQGSFGVGLQQTPGTAAATINYIPAATVNLNMDQMAQSLPQEIGGAMWSRQSYKTGVQVGGDVTFNVRANSIGWLLRAFSGSATAAAPANGVTRHTFIENADLDFIPWVTINKNVTDLWAEQYVDCRVDTFRLDVPAAGIVTGTFGFVGRTTNEIEVPTETFDDTPLFETCTGRVVVGGVSTYKTTRVAIDFSNNLSRDERIIGNYFLDDITVVRRSARITVDTYLKDPTWYRQVYRNGGSTLGAAFDPAVYSAELDLEIQTAQHVVGTEHGKIRLVIPNMDFLTFPVSLSGNDFVRVTMTAELTISGTNPPFYLDLTNTQANYNLS